MTTTIDYVKERKAFGTPVASFQNTKGLVGTAVWTYLVEHNRGGVEAPSQSESVAQRDAGVAQQSATGNGTNISINADNESAAAWQIGTVNLGRGPNNRKPETQ